MMKVLRYLYGYETSFDNIEALCRKSCGKCITFANKMFLYRVIIKYKTI